MELTEVHGGVCAPRGVQASAVHSGLQAEEGRLDMALVYADSFAPVAAGMFTNNVFAAAPVQVSRAAVADGRARAIVLNSGNANAATGEPGMEVARGAADAVARALGCSRGEVLVASTGVIGVELPLEPFEQQATALVRGLSADGGSDAARAIMTTDTHPKEYAVQFDLGGRTCTIGGMCKGSGMIQPDMATMLAVLTTDAPVTRRTVQTALKQAVDASFNKVTVDSDTSTNDSVFLLSTGVAGGEPIGAGMPEAQQFADALQAVCEHLAREIAADGEGATKLVTVSVGGTMSDAEAEAAARTVANSPLVKTAIAGHDCNWGRIAAALGRSGVEFSADETDIDIMGLPVLRGGLPVAFSEEEALARFEGDEVAVDVKLGNGPGHARIWTCDMTHDYISINADYRT